MKKIDLNFIPADEVPEDIRGYKGIYGMYVEAVNEFLEGSANIAFINVTSNDFKRLYNGFRRASKKVPKVRVFGRKTMNRIYFEKVEVDWYG